MSKVVAYKNNERYSVCQIRFDSRERVLVSVAGVPVPSIKIIKLIFGIIPSSTIWELAVPQGEKDGFDWLVAVLTERKDPRIDNPLDAVIHKLLPCRSSYEAVRLLEDAAKAAAVQFRPA